jgi:hypothetical protein
VLRVGGKSLREWVARVPTQGSKPWRFEQLWVNGVRATRARTPNGFWSHALGKHTYGTDPKTGSEADLSRRAFRPSPSDFDLLSRLSPEEIRNVVVVAYHSWETSRHWIAGLDRERRALVVAGSGAAWPFFQWGPNQRYHLENYIGAMDVPGEWLLDSRGVIHYLPRAGEDLRKAEVVAPIAEQFIRIEGDASRPVRHLRFSGLVFRHSRYVLPPEGHSEPQAESGVPAVVMADFAHHVHFEQCEIGHIGIYGVWFRRGCVECSLRRTLIHDMGAGGVRIGEGEIRPEGPERTSHVVVDNSIIQSGGRLHAGAVGIWIGQSGDNRVTHNDIGDLFYTGVSLGWTWGYGPALAQRNHVNHNRIHHIGWGVLSDMGGVYTLGNSEGTTVNNNHIHDVYSYDRYGRGGMGLYNDEGTTHITMENNLVHDVRSGAYHQHYGRENLIRNNILAFSLDGQLQRSRVEGHTSFTFTRNIVVWKGGDALVGAWSDGNYVSSHNLFWRTDGAATFSGRSFAEWQALGKEPGSLIEDPQFADVMRRDFRLRPSSPAARIGFRWFDASRAGVYGDPKWVKAARSRRYAKVDFGPQPPPPAELQISEDFERVPVGSPCPDADTHVEGRGDSVVVTDEAAATGSRSLKFTDAAGLQHRFNPHLVFSPNHRRGVTTLRFSMRISGQADVYHEWRDWTTDTYRAGPNLAIRLGRLFASGQDLCDVPADQWLRYDVRCEISGSSARRWRLEITMPDGTRRLFDDLPLADPGFGTLTWLGFCSNGDQAATTYLDDLSLANR